MNAFEGVVNDYDDGLFDFFDKEYEACVQPFNDFTSFLKKVNDAVELYVETGVKTPLEALSINSAETEEKTRSSFKENIEPPENGETEPISAGRPRRNAFKEATQNINQQCNISLSTKLRRPTKLENELQNVYIKKEKVSSSSTISTDSSCVTVKTENEEMPAPARPAPRKKKQKKTEMTVEIKQEKLDEELQSTQHNRDSEVIIQDTTVTVVNLLDSDDNEDTSMKKQEQESARVTRTKTKQKRTGKRTRVDSSDEGDKKSEKRSKSGPQALTTEPVNETAVSTREETITNKNNDATFIASSPVNKNLAMNSTVVVENPKYVNNIDDLLTDDDSDEEVKKKPPPKTITKTLTKPSKQVFSPFEQSPVKKKVEAFEKLREEATAIPVRTTRTKTRAQAKAQEETDSNVAIETKSVVKEKAKLFTPMTSRFIPSACSTGTKANALYTSVNDSTVSGKSASALKASQAEYRERERKRREKEQEAMKKREALLQAQIEEKKRKREEKQLKAQQQREALEKEKLKALEVQKLKDERHRQVLAEQEERKQKQKEESEKKRQMAKLRAIEEKKREQEKKLEEQRKADELAAKLARQDEVMVKLVQKQKEQREKKLQVPVYMKTKAPLLPTEDCYDSDDDEYEHTRPKKLSWDLKKMQLCSIVVGEAIKNSFFSRQAQTPDLQEIFEVIEPRKLKRSSSAVWHKPPRYTMMPNLDKYSEDDEEYED